MFWVTIACLGCMTSALAKDNSDDKDFQRALSLFGSEQYGGSKRILQKLTKKKPGVALYWFNLGNARFMLNEYSRAISAYEKVIVLKSPLTPAALFYIAKTQKNLGQLEEAEKGLESLALMKLPVNLAQSVNDDLLAVRQLRAPQEEKLVAEGLKFYQEEDYEKALAAANRAIEKKPTPEAYMLKGLSLVKLEEEREALQSFVEVVKRSPKTAIRGEAVQFIRQIREQRTLQQRRISARAEVSGGYNSNVRLSPGVSALHSGSVRALAGAGYYFARSDTFTAEARYALAWQEFTNSTDDRSITHTVEAPLSYSRYGHFLQILPYLQYSYRGTHPYLFRPGFLARAIENFRELEVGLAYELSSNVPGRSEYEYLRGGVQSAQASVGYYFPKLFVSAAYRQGAENTGDITDSLGTLPIANRFHGPSVLLLWFPGGKWEITLSEALSFVSFRTLSQPGSLERQDRQLVSDLQVAYRFNRSWRVFLSAGWLRNSSTLDATTVQDKNFNQWTFQSGASWIL